MTPEAKLEAACVRYAKGRGWLHAKLDPKGNVGVPDHVLFGPGLLRPTVVVVEFKAPRGRTTPKQDHWARQFARLSAKPGVSEYGVVWEIRSLAEFKERLNT